MHHVNSLLATYQKMVAVLAIKFATWDGDPSQVTVRLQWGD